VKHSLSVAFALFIGIAGCGDDEETEYRLFNCEDDFTLMYVGVQDIMTGEACNGVDAITLLSSSCELPERPNGNEVGVANITPCGAPVGTEHQIVVQVNSLYQDQVDRISVRINSGDRGEDEYEMEPDSADEGLYKLTLESVGSEGELRNDTIHFNLWEEI